jgi:peptide chain release factor 2
MKEKDNLSTLIDEINQIDSSVRYINELSTNSEKDNTEKNTLMQEIEHELIFLYIKSKKIFLKNIFSKKLDNNDCFIEIHSGAGGTEAQDWAEMLQRMYTRWVDNHGYREECIEISHGEEIGIKSVIYKIKGKCAYGWLKRESGIHRLIRISPFDSSSKRHTSFASVSVYPVVDENTNVEILGKDIRIDTYRASGAGGQHINKTDSAVRITYLPEKIVVQCQNSRSQHRNKAQAMQMLKARIYENQINKREKDMKNNYNNKTDIGWGYHIRSYILHPYQVVKDSRTETENSNVNKVLNGYIDEFLRSSLIKKV